MKINEVVNAESQLALWKLISDSVWNAVRVQAEQEAKALAAKASQRKLKPISRTPVKRSIPLSKIATPKSNKLNVDKQQVDVKPITTVATDLKQPTGPLPKQTPLTGLKPQTSIT